MPLDYPLASSHVRTIVAVEGEFPDDPDIADPTVELPESLVSGNPTTALAWQTQNRQSGAVKLKVTFRKDDGTEVAGTFTAYGFVVRPSSAAEKELNIEARASIENQGSVDGTSAKPVIMNELGLNDTIGLRLSAMVATDATRAFVHCEEVSE